MTSGVHGAVKTLYRTIKCPVCGDQSALLEITPPVGRHHREDAAAVVFDCRNGCAPEREQIPVRPNDDVTIVNRRRG